MFTQEQEELRATVRAFLGRHGNDDAVWSRLSGELGLTALPIGEAHGGFGASLVEVGIALEEAGAALLGVPLLSTLVASAVLDDSAGDVLPALAAGRSIATLALAEPGAGWALDRCLCRAQPAADGFLLDGTKDYVLDGQLADLALVTALCDGAVALYLVRAEHLTRIAHPTLDQTRGQARFVFASTPARRVGGEEAAAGALDLLHAGLAIESIGVARASLAITVEHLKAREQFGVPLATFQALRHRVADLAVRLESATSSAWYALRAHGTAEFAVAAPLAKLVASEAAYAVTAEGIQLLGGIGFTWEHDAHRYFKRATANRLLGGDPVTLRRLIGARAHIA